MAKIVVLGAGVMGSTLASVAAEKNDVILVGSPLDNDIIKCLKNGEDHPGLQVNVNQNITAIESTELSDAIMQNAQVIVLGVSSPGVNWALDLIESHQASPNIMALVTKGLVSGQNNQLAPQTYAQTIRPELTTPAGRIVGIGGPCIARELALTYPTRVSFAAQDISVANNLRDLLQTDYYFIATNNDFTGLEACAALKNFMCIGVSAMFTSYKLDNSHAKNPLAALFNQAVHEIAQLSRWIKHDAELSDDYTEVAASVSSELAFDLAGLGDLHVTVGGGRNSKLGQFLGSGRSLSEILQTDMHNVTVEGVDTGRQLLPAFRHACDTGRLNGNDFPLTNAILAVIENDLPFKFDFENSAGAELADMLASYLSEKHEVSVLSHNPASTDERYANLSDRVCTDVIEGKFERAVLVCGTGIGVCISANKVPGIRAALCHDTYSAERAALSNNAQVITLGARVIGGELAKSIVDAYLGNQFDEAGRSAGNVSAINEVDEKYHQQP